MSRVLRENVLHVDMDAFFASVELLDRPDLVDKPVLVGHDGPRGVVSSANYVARAYGVRSAMPVAVAKRMCPAVHVLSHRMRLYQEYSGRVREIFLSITPLVEQISIDEAFLDVSGAVRLFGEPVQIARLLRDRVYEQTGLRCSVGIANSKFVAKIATNEAKPDGIRLVEADRVQQFLDPLPISALWGVGKVTEEKLLRHGLHTISDIATIPQPRLVKMLGGALGDKLFRLARGRDERVVDPGHRVEKSISNEVTFERDVTDPAQIRRELLRLAHRVAGRLRAESLVAGTISIKKRFDDFQTVSRSRTLEEPTDVGHQLYEVALSLDESTTQGRPVRLLGIRAEHLRQASGFEQANLLWGGEHDWQQTDKTVDAISQKFGSGAVRPARLVDPS